METDLYQYFIDCCFKCYSFTKNSGLKINTFSNNVYKAVPLNSKSHLSCR
jgi:hypothetical protein